MSKKKTHEEFLRELKNINSDIKVIGTYAGARDNIKVKCLKCGGEWEPLADSLLSGNGCPFCCFPPKKILIGLNDMWTTNPKIAKLLANPEDGYKYMQWSNKKANWKCPNCGYILKNKNINDISRRGLSCCICGDGFSYSEKAILCLFNQLKINYVYQFTSHWTKNFKYDFGLEDFKIVIETHGLQHYEGGFERIKGGKTLEEEQENDRIKKELAELNNYKYIEIDCRKSEIEWIKNSIFHSPLNDLFILSNVDWLKCHEYACSSLVKEVCNYWNDNRKINEIVKIINLHRDTIRKYLKQGTKLNWCDYNAEEESEKNLKNIINKSIKIRSKPVICIETGEKYKSIKEASKNMINASCHHISDCCKGKRKTYGKLEDGTKLHWEYIN